MSSLIPNTNILDQLNFDHIINLDKSIVMSQNASYKEHLRVCAIFYGKVLVDNNNSLFAGRVLMNYLKNIVPSKFSEATKRVYNLKEKNGDDKKVLNEAYYEFVKENAEELDLIIKPERDYTFDIVAVSLFIQSYLMGFVGKKDTLLGDNLEIFETPQYLYLRVATFLWYPNITKIREMYEDLSQKKYIHSSPTLFNSGLRRHQLSSCFLISIGDDLEKITDSWRTMAFISKLCGGIGCDFSEIRHSELSNFGYSDGISKWIKIVDGIVTAIDQGGRRKGSCAVFLVDFHIDIIDFIEMKNPFTDEKVYAKAFNLFYGLFVSDLFMKRVQEGKNWTLFSPNYVSDLLDLFGFDFEKRYLEYEADPNIPKKTIEARELMTKIIDIQMKTGTPYIMYKDACNRKNNQRNLGTIRCGNLCTEIIEYCNHKTRDIASCNLASISLISCVEVENSGSSRYFNFKSLKQSTANLVDNLNQVIDRNYLSQALNHIDETNTRTRPLGIGVQGLADAFAALDLVWTDPETAVIHDQIFETMYYSALKQSNKIAKTKGAYEKFWDSPLAYGLFQFDLEILEQ
jgi:ribonucleoside-diphosphate reductase alpha subunit